PSTSSTGRIPTNRLRARSGSGSRSSADSSGPPGGSVKLVLASASPRRRELLGLLGLDFEVVPSGVAELTAGDPAVIVVENAISKARAIDRPDALVLGVDTDVVCDGRLLGKPADHGDATA